MNHALTDPVNLIGEIDEESSGRCVRRIVAGCSVMPGWSYRMPGRSG